MESLNMGNLANSLPSSAVANAEKDLLDKFKAAAMSITTLYRTSLNTSKQHYNAGYSAALRDLLVVIQQGVSVGGAGNDEDAGMSIGRIMDWIDARLDAIKAREEEEDEEERESSGKSRMRKSTPGVSGVSTGSVIPSSSTTTTISGEKRKPEATPSQTTLPTPRSPILLNRNQIAPPSSPSPPPAPMPTRSSTRLKSRSTTKGKDKDKDKDKEKDQHSIDQIASTSTSTSASSIPSTPSNIPSFNFTMDSPPFVTEVVSVPLSPIIGMKRRHLTTLDPPVCFPPLPGDTSSISTGPSTSTSRRRVKSSRPFAIQGFHSHQHLPRTENSNPAQDAMDIEEEGRERKRVARR